MIADPGWDAPNVVLIGGGNMGGALASGFIARMPQAWVIIVDPNPEQVRTRLPDTRRVKVVPTIADLDAVRPSCDHPGHQAAVDGLGAAAARLLYGWPGPSHLHRGGFTAGAIARELPMARIVRAMPNTPALVGSGVTGLWGDASVSTADRVICNGVFDAVGSTFWVDNETEIDAVTALSGSGPAYVFAFIEALAKAGRATGLTELLAAELARATLIGAASMLRDPARDPACLKAAVRSPGGTTDAALRIFEHAESLHALVGQAVAAAYGRARELSRPARSIPIQDSGASTVD